MTDLEWCRSMLPRVSRTFAMGIQMLPQPFEPWVTVGYLLCRVVDTVEDTESMALFAPQEEAASMENEPTSPSPRKSSCLLVLWRSATSTSSTSSISSTGSTILVVLVILSSF